VRPIAKARKEANTNGRGHKRRREIAPSKSWCQKSGYAKKHVEEGGSGKKRRRGGINVSGLGGSLSANSAALMKEQKVGKREATSSDAGK